MFMLNLVANIVCCVMLTLLLRRPHDVWIVVLLFLAIAITSYVVIHNIFVLYGLKCTMPS
jgi:uncharacterized membrane protein (DUF4010 family)